MMSFARSSGSSFSKPLRAADIRERASRTRPFPGASASMTIEAALILPLFLFFLLNVLNLFEAVRFGSSLQMVLQQCGEELCEKAYYTIYVPEGTEAGASLQLFTKAYVQSRVNAAFEKEYRNRICAGGTISCLQSRVLTEEGNILLIADYKIKPFIPVLSMPGFSMQSCFFGHAWVGYRGEEASTGDSTGEDSEEVYVAKYGVVYHEDRDCIYLNPQVRSVPAAELDTLRSADGSIYHPCEVCHPQRTGMVLVTKEGNRFHCDPDCGGIGRTVSQMEIGEAEHSLRPCPVCAGGAGGHVH